MPCGAPHADLALSPAGTCNARAMRLPQSGKCNTAVSVNIEYHQRRPSQLAVTISGMRHKPGTILLACFLEKTSCVSLTVSPHLNLPASQMTVYLNECAELETEGAQLFSAVACLLPVPLLLLHES
eukprot:COSAG02_NODE_4265_length_5572_cov_3.251416_7_plen_126_part_00